MNRFKTLYVIGEGSFGIVYLAQEKSSDHLVAIKKMKRKYNSWEECMNLREVRSLRKIRHKNIIKLREVFREANQLHLVFDYLESNLFKFYSMHFKEKGKQIPEYFIKKTIFQTLRGIAHLHEKGFFHRDLKPENLLINSDETVQIADFGLAREIRSMPPYTDYISTRWYRAPEMLLKMANYSHPVDVFAIGCIMAELFLQKPLFDGKSELDQLHKIYSVLGEPGANWKEGVALAAKLGIELKGKPGRPLRSILPMASSQALDLLAKMFELDPLKRGSAHALLQHSFFDDLRENCKKSLAVKTEPFGEGQTLFKGGSPFTGSSKKINFKDLMKMDFKAFESASRSPEKKKKTKSPSFKKTGEDDSSEKVSPSMQDFYTSHEDNSLIENKSMTDEIEKIINQHNQNFKKSPKKNFTKQLKPVQSYSRLNIFPMAQGIPSKFGEMTGGVCTPKSFIPYMSDKFSINSKSKSQKCGITSKQVQTQNKENLKGYKSPSEDILPSYMRFMGNVNSQSDFKFHF